ncbi:sulfotransferase [Magnetococcales bacterium HHB-1]
MNSALPSSDPERPRIIYIMGLARSGTTLLEIMLSSGKNVFGAGELTALIQDGLIDNQTCSCQQPFNNCSVWRAIQDDLTAQNLEEQAKLQRRIEWHDGLFRQLLRGLTSEEKTQYSTFNSALLEAIQKNTGASVIIDSSKYAGRALALSELVKADLSVICLTRAPVGLIHSFQKQNEQGNKSLFATMIYYMLVLFSLRLVSFRLKKPVCFVRFEELINHPQQTLNRIATWAQMDLSHLQSAVEEEKPLNVGHIITGNRMRKKGKITFNPAIKTRKQQLSFKEHLVVAWMNFLRWGLRF